MGEAPPETGRSESVEIGRIPDQKRPEPRSPLLVDLRRVGYRASPTLHLNKPDLMNSRWKVARTPECFLKGNLRSRSAALTA